ncbi:MAG: hypothetical protein ABL888_19000 [Pirellulaceae bacterium]
MSTTSTNNSQIQALIAIFPNRAEATKAIQGLQHLDLEFAEISGDTTPAANDVVNELRNVFYSKKQGVNSTDVAEGIAKGAAIGAASGLLFIPVPILGILATVGGFLGGALIGGMAGVDEAMRETKLPDLKDYRDLLAQGKGLVVIPGDEKFRERVGNELMELGAESIHHHPPIAHQFRHPDTEVPPSVPPVAITPKMDLTNSGDLTSRS